MNLPGILYEIHQELLSRILQKLLQRIDQAFFLEIHQGFLPESTGAPSKNLPGGSFENMKCSVDYPKLQMYDMTK